MHIDRPTLLDNVVIALVPVYHTHTHTHAHAHAHTHTHTHAHTHTHSHPYNQDWRLLMTRSVVNTIMILKGDPTDPNPTEFP